MPQTAADPRRADARQLWPDGTLTVAEIAARVGASASTVKRWAKDEAWPSRRELKLTRGRSSTGYSPSQSNAPTPPASSSPLPPAAEQLAIDTTTLIGRLFRIINHNVQAMENLMSDETASGRDPERDMRAIGSVVRSVETLKELESEQSKRDNASERAVVTPEEEDRIRRKVVEHILKLRERKRREGSDS